MKKSIRELYKELEMKIGRELTDEKLRQFFLRQIRKANESSKNETQNVTSLQMDFQASCNAIIAHLNEVTGKEFRASTGKTKSLIRARMNDGFHIKHFLQVIDVKAGQWLKSDFSKYLQPSTLFSEKFEGYLQEWVVQQQTIKSIQRQREAEKAELKTYQDQVNKEKDPERAKLDEQLLKSATQDDWKEFYKTIRGFLRKSADKFGIRNPIVKLMYINFLRNKHESS